MAAFLKSRDVFLCCLPLTIFGCVLMYLKSVEMQGFKSFPDKTVINFNSGITAIVGPNGSGKSNIADAVRWVLGEQSSKTLRGSKMEDVIFDGTFERKAQGFAEVSLTIDNSGGNLPISYDEVTVSRRYFRSGESEYLINRSPVRLKDVHELFMDTGLGRDGYSIIGQGRIAEILSQKSDDRRQIFEEAAGISKYKYRKAEAERKLLSAEENLVRLKDILLELEERLAPLAEQSEKAHRFLDLSAEKRKLEISIWLHNIDNIRSGMEKLEYELDISKGDLTRAEEEMEALSISIDNAFEKMAERTAEIDRSRGEQNSIYEESRETASKIAVLENDTKHIDEQLEELDKTASLERAGLDTLDVQLTECLNRAKDIESRKQTEEENLKEILEKSDKLLQESEVFSEEMKTLRTMADTKRGDLTDMRIHLSSMQSSVDSKKLQLLKLAEELETKEMPIKQLLDEKTKLSDEISDKNAQLSDLKNIILGYELKLKSQNDKNAVLLEECTRIKDELAKTMLRRDTLSDMERHFEGFAYSVKAVMKEAEKGKLSGVFGPVSTLLRVDSKYAAAMETALGASLQNIVVKTENDAKYAINYLKNSGQGRATFLPISAVKGQTYTDSQFNNFPGFIGIAKSLVSYNNEFDGVFSYLLGRVVIVETIDDAVSLAKRTAYRHRIVTLDGQLISPGGSMTGGSAVKSAGILTRQGEIEALEAAAKALEERFKVSDEQYRKALTRTNAEAAYLDGANAEYKTATDELAVMNNLMEQKKFEYNELVKQSTAAQEEINRLNSENEEQNLLINHTLEEISSFEKYIEETEKKYLSLAQNNSDIILLRQKYNEDIAERRMGIMSLIKDIDSENRIAAELNERRTQQAGKANLWEERKKELCLEKETVLFDIEALKEKGDAMKEKVSEIENRIVLLISERELSEREAGELRKSEKDKQSRRDVLLRETERLQNRKENVLTEYDSLVAKLWDEYELTVSEAEKEKAELESITKSQKRLAQLRQNIRALGSVNVDAIEEYKNVSQRYEFLKSQTDDLIISKKELESIIVDLMSKMKGIFTEQFSIINKNFAITFAELFGGGTAELSLTDPSDVLTSGIDIKVTPPGKIIKNLSALSGGEQAFVAIALYFSILKVRPTPFCVLDEIEAALDEINVVRFADYLRSLVHNTQFIAITHRRGTMEEADMLYGVTMQEKGVSKLLAINVSQVAEQLSLA